MQYSSLVAVFSLALAAYGENPASTLWDELKVKRDKLAGVHQEFEVSLTYRSVGRDRTSKWQAVIDMRQTLWRESFSSGSGNHVRIFDGTDVFALEEDSDEYTRTKRHAKEEPTPVPPPYRSDDLEWSKAKELQRVPCGLKGRSDQCVLLEIPVKRWTRNGARAGSMTNGSRRLLVDLENGLIIFARTVENIERQDSSYQSDRTYMLKRMTYGDTGDLSLFQLPTGQMHEVKELSAWDAARIRKQLGGKPAPDLTVTDIEGRSFSLAAAKGKVVLLDFWTTWCPPCREDAPLLDKLYRKYGAHDLAILGISVSEDHTAVARFLKEHPHDFPVALTTENEMPRPYQIGRFPTYIVIDRNGELASVTEGGKDFSELRKMLKKAGLEAE